ncbi:MAG TPA: hypothetical protein VFF03_17125 [Rhodocyclaceae bacterium]|nr:hypothetical protein [Rhodocyclaceae bacterium]
MLLFSLMAAVAMPAPAAIDLKPGTTAERPAGPAGKKRVREARHREREVKRLAARAVEQIVILGEIDLGMQDGIWFTQGLDLADLIFELFSGHE